MIWEMTVSIRSFPISIWNILSAVAPLLDLPGRHPDLVAEEVLERLNPIGRTMLAQVGRPWRAALLASRLPRIPKRPPVRLRLNGATVPAP